MIRPSHAEGRFSANREFTDRDDARQIFDAACAADQPRDAYKVLMWYGVGGQGKSALARECERRLEVLKAAAVNLPQKKRYGIAKVDFEDARLRDIHEALLALRLQLARSVGLSFPAFDTAFARYFALSNPGVNMRQRHPELFRGENELLDDLLDWSEEGIASMAIVAAVDAGLAVPGVNVIYKYAARLRGRAIEWWDRRGKTVLAGLDALRPDELLEKLPTFLGSDICDGLQADAALRPVILLDTYEALWRDRGLADGETAMRADRWVRRLVQDAPGVLFVLFGRDRLNWSEEAADWSGIIDDHLLGELSDEDSDAFLKKVPVEDAKIRTKIIEGARGLPFYLDLQVDLFEGLRNQGEQPKAEHFGGTHALILTRFLDHLGENEKALLRLASYPLVLDQAAMNNLTAAFLGGAAHMNWHSLTAGRSFMSPGADGTVIMHVLLREALQRRERDERSRLFRDIHQHLFQQFDAACAQGDDELITRAHENALRSGLHHLANAAPDRVFDWIDGCYPRFHRFARWQTLEAVLRHALSIVRQERSEEHQNTLKLRHNIADQIDRQGRYADAEREYRDVWEIQRRPEILGEEHADTLTTRHNLALVIGNQRRFDEAEREYRKIWEIRRRPDVLGEEHHHTLKTRHNLALMMGNQGRYAEAEREFRFIWEVLRRPENLGAEHPDTLTAQHNIAFLIGKQGRYIEAERELRVVWDIRRRPEILGEYHPNTLTTLHNIALQIGWQGRHSEAEREFRAVWEVKRRPDVLGEEHPSTLNTRTNVATQIGLQGRYAEAEREFRAVWDILRRTNAFGENQQVDVEIQYWIAKMLDKQDKYDAASELLVIIENNIEQKAGLEHNFLKEIQEYIDNRN